MTQTPDKIAPSLGHILVAEDDVIAQTVVKRILEQLGYTMDLVVDGQAAIHALESKHYDLVLMDCLMPRMNGFDAARAIRTSDSPRINSGIPIIAMTGLTAEADHQRCLDAGMYEVVSKPVDAGSLLPVIRHCMSKSEETGPAVEPGEDNSEQAWDDTILDVMIDEFLADAPKAINDLQLAVEQGDPEKLRNIAHQFRGTTGLLKVSGLSARSLALEQAANAGQTQLTLTHATELIEELQKLMRVLAE